MKKYFLLPLILLVVAVLLTCTKDVQSPFTHDKAKVFIVLQSSTKITNDSTITDTISDTVRIGVRFFMDTYFDSVLVTVGKSITTLDTFFAARKADIKNDTIWFSCAFASEGKRIVSATGYVEGGYRPTASGTISIVARPAVPVNHKPKLIITGRETITTAETCTLFVTAVHQDTGQMLSYKVLRGPQGYTFGNQVFTWKPAAAADTGTDTVTFSVADNSIQPLSDTQSVAITVTTKLNPPSPIDSLRVFGKNNDTASLQWHGVSNADSFLVYRSNNRTVNYLPRGSTKDTTYKDQILTYDYYYYVKAVNAAGASYSDTIYSGDFKTDASPHAISQSVTIKEDSSAVITLIAVDPEGKQIAAWQIIDTVKHGVLIGSTNNYTYTPKQYFHGPDTFTFRASDGTKWSDTATVSINVAHVNHPPTWKQTTVNLSTKEGKTLDLDLSTVFDKDPDGDSVTFSLKSGVGSIKPDGKTWTWSPDFTAAAGSPAASVVTATDNGTPKMSADISLSISVADSVCKLTLSVTTGQGSFTNVPTGTTFDPGTEVQVTAVPAKDYVFKAWQGDTVISDSTKTQFKVIMSSDRRISASFLKAAETITLNVGESYVHGSCYAEGYYFLSTRTSPAKLLRINANNLTDHAEITFSSGHNNADQLVYVPSKKKLYVVFGSNTRNMVAEVDPFTMTYIEEKICDTVNANSITSNCQSMASDGQYLYVLANRKPTKILKYSLTTFSSTPAAIATLDSSKSLGHAIYYENGFLYLSNYGYGLWFAKIDANTMQLLDSASIGGESFTDDFAMTQDYIFEGLEASYGSANNGAIYRITKNNLSQVFKINTGTKGDSIYYAGQCYGTLNTLGYIWAIFASKPGILTRIDPVSLQFVNYKLEYNTPNEIISDGKRLFITYWAQDPGVIQAFDPSYLIGKEIP